MEKIVQQGLLYDFYGELLTDHQKQVYEALVYENMSLGEIASEQGVSRQAIHDLIKRTDKILEGYESKLGLVKRFTQIKNQIAMVEDKLKGLEPDSVKQAQINELLSLCASVVDYI